MDRSKTVLLIMGSTRFGRICPRVTEWVAQIGRAWGTRCARQLRQVAAAVIREGAALDPDRDFKRYLRRVQRALAQLASQVNGRERFLTRAHRRCKALLR
jgi:NAD(P)H-dependent FMN reductase